MQISVVVPVYNSKKTIQALCKKLNTSLKNIGIKDFEIILVDDGSKDDSYKKMKELYNSSLNINIIKLAGNFGQQNALMCGLRHAKGDLVVTLDDDLQNPPEEIEKLVAKINEGYDVVFGVPYEKKHPVFRNLGTKLISRLFNKICNKPKAIEVSSFRLIRKSIVEKMIKDKRSFVYLAPIILNITQNVSTVFVRHEVRKEGKSNYSYFKLCMLVGKLFLYYSLFKDSNLLCYKPQYIIKDIKLRGDKKYETTSFGR